MTSTRLESCARVALVLAAFLAAAVGIANGQVSPQGTHHTTVGPGTGVVSPVSPTGGFAASVPLDLPSPRGGLPVPLSIVYTGSIRAGAVGAGWDIPIWYVRRSNDGFRRKPAASSSHPNDATERIYLSLGSGPQLMVPHGAVYVPFMGSDYRELRRDGDGWRLRTLDNVEYVFVPKSSVGFPGSDFWVLKEVRDLTGSDKVTITYDLDSGCVGKPELNVGTIAHTFNSSGTPLYEIKLNYRRWNTESCDGIDNVSEGEIGFTRNRILESIAIKARNNLDPNSSSSPKRIRRYDIVYGLEQDTYKPAMIQVWVHGEEGSTTPPQPVQNYGYSMASRAPDAQSNGRRIVEFGPWEVVPRPTFVTSSTSYKDDIATSEVYSYNVQGLNGIYDWARGRVETTRARHLMRDFTGDGVPDLVVHRGEGNGWALYPSRLATEGVGFTSTPTTWSGSAGPAELHVESTFRFTESTANGAGAPFVLGDDPGRFAREALITSETWNQFIDWNGDGRLDVVDVKGGQSSNHWKIWLNEPSTNGDALQWRAIQVDIGPLRDDLAARGLRRDNYELQATGLDWSDRLPIQRTRSWPRSETYQCTIQECTGFDQIECHDVGSCGTDYEHVYGTDSITEWQLADANEDGFVDFVSNEHPVRYCETNTFGGNSPGCTGNPYLPTVSTYSCTETHTEMLVRSSTEDCNDPLTDEGRALVYLNYLGPFTGVAASPFAATPLEQYDVVGHWTTGTTTNRFNWGEPPPAPSGFSWQSSTLQDQFGWGRLTSNTNENFDPDVAATFDTDRHLQCVDDNDGANTFVSRQTRGEADLNGDGLADRIDLVGGERVLFNTGVGYGPSRELRWPGDNFAISESSGRCDGDAHTRAGLTDLDGDGKPELLRAKGGVLYMSRLRVGEGDNLHSVGKLMQIGNLRGALLRIVYGNAKREFNTEHAVPFPEIVVRQTFAWTSDGSAPTSAPTHYAYGGARLEYDPLAGRWTFPGYRRTATITGGVLGQTTVSGVLAVSESNPGASPGATYVDHVAAHFPAKQSFYDNTFNINLLDAFLNESVPGAFAGITTKPYAQFVEPQVAVSDLEHLECGDLDPATGQPFGYGRCGSAGVVYTSSTEAWEGIVAPPAAHNVYVGSSVELVDMYGRPLRVHKKGDLRSNDDDVCSVIEYAVPADSGPFPSVPASVELDDCGYESVDEGAPPGTPRVIAASRFEYDGLAAGQVAAGRVTRRLVDRYDDTGYRDTHEAASLTYDALGEVRTVSSSRALGSPATTTTTLSRDPYGVSVTQIVDAASDVAAPLVRTAAQSTWPSLGASSTDANGIIRRVEFDGHGRVTHERVTGALGVKATLRRIAYANDGRSTTSDVFTGTTAPGQEDAATDRIRSITYFDALLRPRFTQTLLGADYANSTMVSNYVEYDALGRIVFAAQPFESATIPYSPGPAQYGVTNVFDRRGRLVRTVEALGRDEVSTLSSVQDDRYVSTFAYGYLDGRAWHRRQGPDENDPSSPRLNHRDESWRTALGQEVERARFSSSNARIDLVRQEWDRLGRSVRTERFVDPATGFVPVSWTSRYDSLGRRLSLTEPGMATRFTEYDEQGNAIESWWQDGVTRHITRNRYDGLGREIERRIIKSISGVEQIQSHDRFHYDQHSGQSADQPVGDYRGRLSWMETIGVGAVYHSYDDWGRADTTSYRFIDNPQLVREQGIYTAGGRLTQLILETPSTIDAIGYEYDSAGRVRLVEDVLAGTPYWEALQTEFDGFYRWVQLGNGVLEDFERSPHGRRELMSWAANTNSGIRRHIANTRDAAGRVVQEAIPNDYGSEVRTYSFDSLGRLTKSNHAQFLWFEERFEYDALGNLARKDIVNWYNSDVRIYQPDAADPDRLCRFGLAGTSGPCTFAYDGMGNVTVDSSYGPMFERHIEYDAAGRMIAMQRSSYGAIMTYGPSGRVRLQVDGVTDRDYWTFGGLIEEQRIGADNMLTRNIPGPMGNIATRRKNATSETIVYSHGNGRANYFFTDEQGGIVQSAYYSPFGQTQVTNHGGAMTTTDDLWNGGDNVPELGVVLLGPRAYDPEMGRFLQRDPVAITFRASSANPYAFAFSDPVNFADPTGLTPTRYGGYNVQPAPYDPRALLVGTGFALLPRLLDSAFGGGGGPARAVGLDAVSTPFLGSSSAGIGSGGESASFGTTCSMGCRVNGAINSQRHRIEGAVRLAGGYAMVHVGTGLLLVPGAEGVGVGMIAVGTDQAAAGATSVIYNRSQRSAVNILVAEATGSQAVADNAEGGLLGALSGSSLALARAVPKTVSQAGFDPPPAALPPYLGKKTSGVLHTPGAAPEPLISGVAGPSQLVRNKGLPGFNGNQLTHVEGHAAARMRVNNIREAVLDINQAPCTVGRGGGCAGLLESMLPEGAILRVRSPQGERIYIGLPDK